MKFAVFTAFLLLSSAAHAAPEQQDPEKIIPDFQVVKGTTKDEKHTPLVKAPKTVTAGEWFPVTISIGAGSTHPSWVEHHVRWIALEADGVEINRVYLHPVMSKPEVTFVIALADERTFGPDGELKSRKDKVVTLRGVEAPTHASQFWADVQITVKSPKK